VLSTMNNNCCLLTNEKLKEAKISLKNNVVLHLKNIIY